MPQDTKLLVKIRPATFPADKEVVAQLFLAYAQSLPISLDFQGFELELAALPGKYAESAGGAIFLAYTSQSRSPTTSTTSPRSSSPHSSSPNKFQVIGCIGIRSFTSPTTSIPTCELKRLYLTPACRGLGVSKLLMDIALKRAGELGYKEILLDTLSSMVPARRLYAGYGFSETTSYYESVEGAVFYRLLL